MGEELSGLGEQENSGHRHDGYRRPQVIAMISTGEGQLVTLLLIHDMHSAQVLLLLLGTGKWDKAPECHT